MCVEIEALLNAPIPPTHDEIATLDCYEQSLGGIDLNVNSSTSAASAYPLQPSLLPMHNPSF